MDLYIGKNVFVRTVTFHYTGKLTGISDGFLHLADAAWIADSGRFAAALKDGTLSEVEPYPAGCSISAGAVVDISEWTHELPRKVK